MDKADDRRTEAVGRKGLLVLLLLVALSRVPFVDLGLGSHTDAWRVGLSAYDLISGNGYHLSRKPGYPVMEFLCAPLLAADEALGGSGWIVINVFMLGVTVASVGLFYGIAKRLGARSPLLVASAFAFYPLFWEESLGGRGIGFALAILLGAFYAALRRRRCGERPIRRGGRDEACPSEGLSREMWAAAVLLGLATGARLPMCVGVLPMAYLAWRERRRLRDAAIFCAVSGAVGAACMIPVLCVQGLDFVPKPDVVGSLVKKWAWVLGYKGIGLNACLLLAIGLASAGRRMAREVLRERNAEAIFLALCILPPLAVFLAKPYYAAYALAALPFGLVFLDRQTGRKLFFAFCVAGVLNGFLVTPGIDREVFRQRGAVRVKAIAPGDLIEEYARWRELRNATAILEAQAAPPHSAIVMGHLHQAFWFQGRHRVGKPNGLRRVDKGPIDEYNNALYDEARDIYYLDPYGSAFSQEKARLRKAGYVILHIASGALRGVGD